MDSWQQLHTTFFDRRDKKNHAESWSTTTTSGLVSSAHYLASAMGAQVLELGGNAVDAALAVSLTLGLVEPAASGPGGMAMLMIYLSAEGRTLFLPGACRAPYSATQHKVAQANRRIGYQAIAVPTNIAAFACAHEKFGCLKLVDILPPIIDLARTGFPLTHFQQRLLRTYRKSILQGNAAAMLLADNGAPASPGKIITNCAYSQTLQTLMQHGLQDFYHGQIAHEILEDMHQHNGFVTAQDFAHIPFPQEQQPLSTDFFTWQVQTTPPPGGGMALLEMLNLFQALAPKDFDPDSPQAALLLASIIRQVRQDRRKHKMLPLDLQNWHGPDLLSKNYAQQAAAKISARLNQGETSHFNVADRYGNVVAVTQSIERSFGAKVATPQLGFLYNGFLKAFKIENTQHPYFLQPGKPARSNAAPTIVFQNAKPIFALGSTGSERMSSGIFQVLVRLHAGQTAFQALSAPRLHCTPEGVVFLEPERFSAETPGVLFKHGFTIEPYDSPWSFSAGGLHVIGCDGETQIGVADPRRDGAAISADMLK